MYSKRIVIVNVLRHVSQRTACLDTEALRSQLVTLANVYGIEKIALELVTSYGQDKDCGIIWGREWEAINAVATAHDAEPYSTPEGTYRFRKTLEAIT